MNDDNKILGITLVCPECGSVGDTYQTNSESWEADGCPVDKDGNRARTQCRQCGHLGSVSEFSDRKVQPPDMTSIKMLTNSIYGAKGPIKNITLVCPACGEKNNVDVVNMYDWAKLSFPHDDEGGPQQLKCRKCDQLGSLDEFLLPRMEAESSEKAKSGKLIYLSAKELDYLEMVLKDDIAFGPDMKTKKLILKRIRDNNGEIFESKLKGE